MSNQRKTHHIFDVLGPIMIGPSSSHTAGACRLALLAKTIYQAPFHKVLCELHGSFAHTYQGHGSDRALAGGLLGFQPDDARLREALTLAEAQGIEIVFEQADLGPVHPNTIRFTFFGEDEPFTVTGSSVGGGAIVIININGTEVTFTGENPTLILRYEDRFAMIHEVTGVVRLHRLNIAALRVTRDGTVATMIIELDEPFDPELPDDLNRLPGILFFKALN